MGVVITGLALGITIATVFAPNMIDARRRACSRPTRPGGCRSWCSAPRRWSSASRSRPTSAARSPACRTSARRCTCWPSPRVGLARGHGRLLRRRRGRACRDLWIAVLEVALALVLVAVRLHAPQHRVGAGAARPRPVLINLAFIAVLWNLWFFGFWSVSIVADAAGSSFGRSALIAAFNAGAGILGFPAGGWLSDVAVRRGIGRKPLRDRASPRAVRADADLRLRRRRRRARTSG